MCESLHDTGDAWIIISSKLPVCSGTDEPFTDDLPMKHTAFQ